MFRIKFLSFIKLFFFLIISKNLIKTQKQLIETLKNMGPALKDGRQVLDTFKNYFGSEQDIGAAMKNLKA